MRANPESQRGVTLALLLWIVAALTLLVSGIVALARTDVQLTSLQLNQAQAQAVARGAGHLLMRDLTHSITQGEGDGESYDGQGIFRQQYQIDGMTTVASAVPVGGYININTAPVELMAAVFQYVGELPSRQAEDLAELMAEWRAGSVVPGEERAARFGAVEDLLRVPGINRMLYDKISPALHAQSSAPAGVNPAAAPEEVLRALSQGDGALVDFILDSRQDVRPGEALDYAGLPFQFLSQSNGSVYCLVIDVHITETRVFQQRIWVDAASGRYGVPWRFTRVSEISVKPSTGDGSA